MCSIAATWPDTQGRHERLSAVMRGVVRHIECHVRGGDLRRGMKALVCMSEEHGRPVWI